MDSQTHFVAFKTLMSIFLIFEYSFIIFAFHLELHKVYLDGARTEKTSYGTIFERHYFVFLDKSCNSHKSVTVTPRI